MVASRVSLVLTGLTYDQFRFSPHAAVRSPAACAPSLVVRFVDGPSWLACLANCPGRPTRWRWLVVTSCLALLATHSFCFISVLPFPDSCLFCAPHLCYSYTIPECTPA